MTPECACDMSYVSCGIVNLGTALACLGLGGLATFAWLFKMWGRK